MSQSPFPMVELIASVCLIIVYVAMRGIFNIRYLGHDDDGSRLLGILALSIGLTVHAGSTVLLYAVFGNQIVAIVVGLAIAIIATKAIGCTLLRKVFFPVRGARFNLLGQQAMFYSGVRSGKVDTIRYIRNEKHYTLPAITRPNEPEIKHGTPVVVIGFQRGSVIVQVDMERLQQ